MKKIALLDNLLKYSTQSAKKKNILYFLVIATSAMCVISCSNNSELRFMGKNISVSREEFEKHLEQNGFKYYDVIKNNGDVSKYDSLHIYKGKYLGEEVSVMLRSKKKNGHYTQLTLMSLFSDMEKAQRYYDKVCEEIGKEHKGFKEEDDDDNIPFYNTEFQRSGSDFEWFRKKDYYNGSREKIQIGCYSDSNHTITVITILESDN